MADMAALARNVLFVDIDPQVLQVLHKVHDPTLLGAFGDYRPPMEQRIGIGDGVQITLWEAAAGGLFSSPVVDNANAGSRSAVIPEQVVERDGSITVPFAGRISVVDRTPPEVERVIVNRLADKAIQPQALVTVVHNESNTASIIREGAAGARVPLNVRGIRILDLIAASGGNTSPTNDTVVQLNRGGRVMRVPMAALLADPQQNIFVMPGDIINLSRDPLSFTANGALVRNGLINFDAPSLTMDEAVAKAGGLADERADPSSVYVGRYETADIAARLPNGGTVPTQPGGVPTIYHFNLRDPGSAFAMRGFTMRNHDLLYVANSRFNDLQKVFNLMNLLISPALTAATVKNAAP